MLREEAAFALAESYVKEYKKYSFKTFNPHKVDKTKWWKHFLKAADQRYVEDWSPDLWVKCQFEANGKIYPFALIGKRAEENFREFKYRFLEAENKDDQIIKSMINTHKQLKNKEINETDIMKIKRGFYSIHYLSVYKPFRNINKNKEILDEDMLNIKRAYIYKNKILKETLKRALENNFY